MAFSDRETQMLALSIVLLFEWQGPARQLGDCTGFSAWKALLCIRICHSACCLLYFNIHVFSKKFHQVDTNNYINVDKQSMFPGCLE